jgi:hypothetical protein
MLSQQSAAMAMQRAARLNISDSRAQRASHSWIGTAVKNAADVRNSGERQAMRYVGNRSSGSRSTAACHATMHTRLPLAWSCSSAGMVRLRERHTACTQEIFPLLLGIDSTRHIHTLSEVRPTNGKQ